MYPGNIHLIGLCLIQDETPRAPSLGSDIGAQCIFTLMRRMPIEDAGPAARLALRQPGFFLSGFNKLEAATNERPATRRFTANVYARVRFM